jgi:hypothetical protein
MSMHDETGQAKTEQRKRGLTGEHDETLRELFFHFGVGCIVGCDVGLSA